MNDVWSIIGLSSLVASVVTVILGIVRDVLVEKYRFKRESEAGYVQSQIKVYSQIYFLLRRLRTGAIASELFGELEDNIKELNNLIKTNASLVESRVLNKWVYQMALTTAYLKDPEDETSEEIRKDVNERVIQLASIIKEIMNNNLIPKYRRIVGETVPALE